MNSKGILWVYSNSKNSALLAIALQRAKTAREAIKVMGSLAEKYGYAQTGEHITVTDGKEVWAFEIFGPGADWTPGSGNPGAVWCAQRIPDGHVGVSANRSRIGEIDLNNPDYFMASRNVYSLAIEKGWWNPKSGKPFVWYEAYSKPMSWERGSSIREWRILSLVAPSLKLDIGAGRFPFSVKPDKPLSVQDVITIHRDTLQGTHYDLTENAAFYLKGEKGPEKSSLACPFGPSNLHKLLRVSSERLVGTDTSCFVSVTQVRANLPDPIKACMWFTLGPVWSGCFVPVYSGCSKLPESWASNNHARIVRGEAMWALKLTHELSYINYQNASKDSRAVRDPVEGHFFAQQGAFEKAALDIYKNLGETAARQFVINYTNACMNSVADGYWDLVDYLLFTYYFRSSWKAPQKLPVIQPTKMGP
jgi:dipeptidase